jgi:predicted dehydrogenase
MRHAPSATLLALASRELVKAREAAQQFDIPRAYGSYEELLGDADIDAVYIPLPINFTSTGPYVRSKSGKHVLCEKPLCLTSEQVKTLCAVRDRTGRHIEEGLGFRNHPQWRSSQN